MKKTYHLFIASALALIYTQAYAGNNPIVAQTPIATASANLRQSNATVLGSVGINAPSAGKVLVRFDGTCISDSADQIVLAASETHSWVTNCGNASFQSGTTSNRRSFSHSRVYTVAAGIDSFYAVAQNFGATSGSGVASIYGSLTAEFFPAAGEASVTNTDVVYSGNLRGSVVLFDSVNVVATNPGLVIPHFDGIAAGSPGDRIELATNNTPNWNINDGVVAIEAVNATNVKIPFSHTRSFAIGAGTETMYAVGQNYVQTAGTGNGYVYGDLSAEYFPTAGPVIADMHGLVLTGVNLRTPTAVKLDSISINAPTAGQVLVQFDGKVIATVGDRIILAASNDGSWGVNDGNTSIAVSSPTDNYDCFSHSRLYPVGAGTHQYYAVAQNFVDVAGSGVASIFGSLVVKFFPNVIAGIDEVQSGNNSFSIYPNPGMDKVTILTENLNSNTVVELLDLNGRTLHSQIATSTETKLDISQLDAGIYLVKVNGQMKKLVKQ